MFKRKIHIGYVLINSPYSEEYAMESLKKIATHPNIKVVNWITVNNLYGSMLIVAYKERPFGYNDFYTEQSIKNLFYYSSQFKK